MTALGAREFGWKPTGDVGHISIRRLQEVLLKDVLLLGGNVSYGVEFRRLLPPNARRFVCRTIAPRSRGAPTRNPHARQLALRRALCGCAVIPVSDGRRWTHAARAGTSTWPRRRGASPSSAAPSAHRPSAPSPGRAQSHRPCVVPLLIRFIPVWFTKGFGASISETAVRPDPTGRLAEVRSRVEPVAQLAQASEQLATIVATVDLDF